LLDPALRAILPPDAIDPPEEQVVMQAAEALEAPWVNVSHFRGTVVAHDLMAEAIGGACRRAAARGLGIALEFNPDTGLPEEYDHKLREASESHHLPGERVLFLEVRPGDVSDFAGRLTVRGVDVSGHHVLRCVSPAIPNAIAALLLYIRDETGRIPHAYFGWTEGNPLAYLLKFLAFGEGDTAPVTREVLRQSEPDPLRRPRIHVG
jgi:hypothetical protein